MARLLALHVADMQIIGQQVSRQHLAPGGNGKRTHDTP
jgi:hypothetical protein